MPSMINVKSSIKLWHIVSFLLILANVAYFLHNVVGWLITLSFFLFVPGYLILAQIQHTIRSRWEILSFSLGLSLLFLLIGGLGLNTLHYVGLERPLDTLPIFVSLDVLTIGLIYLNRHKAFSIPHVYATIKSWHIVAALSMLILPLLAAAGALRLNNGASNVLTLILFATIAIMFLFFVWRKDLYYVYPYALVIFAFSVLLTVSLRGWEVTGHDIQREFQVFTMTFQKGFWDIAAFRDPYNACLSITILPTLLAKITSISEPYIFKVVFQAIFAFCLVPIYFFLSKIVRPRIALMSAFLFIAFPTFLNDMAMLNRQEICFMFFSLVMLLIFTEMKQAHKKFLIIMLLVGTVLAHYSTSYVTIGILFVAWLLYLLLRKLFGRGMNETLPNSFPTLNITIVLVALLSAFLWNSQITASTKGLGNTIVSTIEGLIEKSTTQSLDVAYSIFGGEKQDPQELLTNYAEKHDLGKDVKVTYVTEPELPVTPFGERINRIVDVGDLNEIIRNLTAKFIQAMLLVGCVVLFFTYRKKTSEKNIYFLALVGTCVLFLILQTILPQLSVDYGILRLFQQELIILALPSVVGMLTLLKFAPRLQIPVASGIIAFLFLHLSGFIPQITGGYQPQLALNNAGFYYDAYYISDGEKRGASWLNNNRQLNVPVAMDAYAQTRFNVVDKQKMVILHLFTPTSKAYIYNDRVNETTNKYIANVNSNLYYYTITRKGVHEHTLYSNNVTTIKKLTNKR